MHADVAATFQFLNAIDTERPRTEQELALSQKALLKGARLSDKGDKRRAARHCLEAYGLDPKNRKALALLGNLLCGLGRRQEAIEVFERLLKLGDLGPGEIFDVANMAGGLDMPQAAEDLFATYIQIRPAEARGYIAMSGVKRALGKYDDAIELLRFAIGQDPERGDLWEALGVAVGEDRGVEAARPFFEEAIRLKPEMAASYANFGRQLNAEGRFAEAVPLLEKGVELLPGSANSHFNLATALLGTGDLERGWTEYGWRLDKSRPDSVNYTHGLPRWQGEDIADKVILVCDEQGLGDLFMFATAFDELIRRARHCVFECDPRLITVMQRSFPAATFHRHVTYSVNARLHRNYRWLDALDQRPDIATESGTVLRYLRPHLASFADSAGYLKPDPARVAFWRERFAECGPGLKVGLTWRGGLRSVARDRAYASIDAYRPILEVPGITFFNSMYADTRDEIAYAAERLGVTIHDFDDIDRRNQLDEAAAYTAALDHVVSVRSSPGAIASALGVPTSTLQEARGQFMLGTDHEPCYPCRSIFFAARRADWPHEPIGRIAEHLRGLAEAEG